MWDIPCHFSVRKTGWNTLDFPVFWIVQLFSQGFILEKNSCPNLVVDNENVRMYGFTVQILIPFELSPTLFFGVFNLDLNRNLL